MFEPCPKSFHSSSEILTISPSVWTTILGKQEDNFGGELGRKQVCYVTPGRLKNDAIDCEPNSTLSTLLLGDGQEYVSG